jgi:hypothetical protein
MSESMRSNRHSSHSVGRDRARAGSIPPPFRRTNPLHHPITPSPHRPICPRPCGQDDGQRLPAGYPGSQDGKRKTTASWLRARYNATRAMESSPWRTATALRYRLGLPDSIGHVPKSAARRRARAGLSQRLGQCADRSEREVQSPPFRVLESSRFVIGDGLLVWSLGLTCESKGDTSWVDRTRALFVQIWEPSSSASTALT